MKVCLDEEEIIDGNPYTGEPELQDVVVRYFVVWGASDTSVFTFSRAGMPLQHEHTTSAELGLFDHMLIGVGEIEPPLEDLISAVFKSSQD